jgi:ribosomal protein S18 acetylase RimI-like enzyme
MALVIRPAEPADALAVARVHVRAWQGAYRGLMADAYLDGLRPEDRATRYTFAAPPPAPQTVVALDGDAVVGFATITTDARDPGELLAINVDPDAWRHRVGSALIAEARAGLVAQGCRTATLWLLVGNERAARFYERDGWSFDGTRRTDEVWGITVDELRYRCTL